jgi:hypothetical protein
MEPDAGPSYPLLEDSVEISIRPARPLAPQPQPAADQPLPPMEFEAQPPRHDPDAWFAGMTASAIVSTFGVGMLLMSTLGSADKVMLESTPTVIRALAVCDVVAPMILWFVLASTRGYEDQAQAGRMYRIVTMILSGTAVVRAIGVVMIWLLSCYPDWDKAECVPACFMAFLLGFCLITFLAVVVCAALLATVICLFESI